MSSLFTTEQKTNIKAPRRTLLILIPLLLIGAIAMLFFFTGWNKLANAQEVDVVRARISASSGLIKEGKTLFQAAGWIHADPYPIDATALVSGIVTELHVIGGQQVKKGQLLAKLNSEDFELSLLEAQAILKELQLDVKRELLEVHTLESKIQENKSLKETALASAQTAQNKADRLKKSGIGVTKLDQEQAELEYREKFIRTREFDQKIVVLETQIKHQKQKIEIAQAKVEVQRVKMAKIQLNLSRCNIHSPIDGIIQKLYARVGRKQMLNSDNEHSTSVAKIFNPKEVLVMVDVPLNDLQKVKLKQKTKIHLEAIDETLNGIVTALHGEADYQKNTLQIHVSIPGGHKDVRPDMLAQVEFLADKLKNQQVEAKSGLFIDKRCLTTDNKIFVISLNEELEQRTVETGEEKEGWIEVLSGLKAGEKAVLNPNSSQKNGQAVKIGDLHE